MNAVSTNSTPIPVSIDMDDQRIANSFNHHNGSESFYMTRTLAMKHQSSYDFPSSYDFVTIKKPKLSIIGTTPINEHPLENDTIAIKRKFNSVSFKDTIFNTVMDSVFLFL